MQSSSSGIYCPTARRCEAGPRNPHTTTAAGLRVGVSLLSGVSYILHVAHPPCVSLCQPPSPPLPSHLCNLGRRPGKGEGERRAEEWINSGCSLVSALGERFRAKREKEKMPVCENVPLQIDWVCLCVGAGESIYICVHISGVSAAFFSGDRPVFWARGHADCRVHFKRYGVCVFHWTGQQVPQRREHKNAGRLTAVLTSSSCSRVSLFIQTLSVVSAKSFCAHGPENDTYNISN